MTKSCINKSIAVKILTFADMHKAMRDILHENGYTVGDTIYLDGGRYDDDIGAMIWPILNLVGETPDEVRQFNAEDFDGIFAFCTSYCIKESAKNIYGNYTIA